MPSVLPPIVSGILVSTAQKRRGATRAVLLWKPCDGLWKKQRPVAPHTESQPRRQLPLRNVAVFQRRRKGSGLQVVAGLCLAPIEFSSSQWFLVGPHINSRRTPVQSKHNPIRTGEDQRKASPRPLSQGSRGATHQQCTSRLGASISVRDAQAETRGSGCEFRCTVQEDREPFATDRAVVRDYAVPGKRCMEQNAAMQ